MNNLKLILILIIILIIIHMFGRSEGFETDSTETSTNPDVLYSQIINYKKYTEVDLNQFKDTNQIPKIIIQTWKSDYIPHKYVKEIQSLKNTNPDYTFIYFNDTDIENFLSSKYPEYYEVYKSLPVKIQKIDFFRYIAIYHYGGFYFDLDITGLKSLNDLLGYQCIFPIDQHLTCVKPNNRIKHFCEKGINFLFGQYALAARKNDSFIKLLCDTIKYNIDYYNQEYKTNKSQWYVYGTTGPDFVTQVYMNYKDKNLIHILYHKENQYFGDYAKHNCFGTWKK